MAKQPRVMKSKGKLRLVDMMQYALLDPDVKNAQYVAMTSASQEPKRRHPSIKCVTVTRVPNETPRRHRQLIESVDPKYRGSLSRCDAVRASCDCLTGDTKVLTKDGWKTLLELAAPVADEYPIRYVLNDKKRWGSNSFYKGRKKVWKLTLSNGMTITGTKDHRLLQMSGWTNTPIFDGKGRGRTYSHTHREIEERWTTIGDLSVGDRLFVHTRSVAGRIDIGSNEYREAFFAGIMMGDGTITKEGNLDLHLYGHKASLVDQIPSSLIKKVRVLDDKHRGIRVAFTHEAREVLEKLTFRNKESINISSPNHIVGYLSGLIATDGSISKGSTGITICGGELYLSQLRDHLVALGVHDLSYHLASAKGDKTNYGERKKDVYRLQVSGQSLDDLRPYLVLNDKQLDPMADYLERWRVKFGNLSKPPCVRIVAKEYAGKQDVYDVTVPKGEMFVANGIIAHNCARHQYTWEYALAHHGASWIQFSNGEYPVETNPSLYPGVCIAGYELVTTDKGLVRMDKIRPGMKVQTLDGLREVTQFTPMGKKPLVRLRFDRRNSLDCTWDHPVMALTEMGLAWIPAKDLRVGDQMVMPHLDGAFERVEDDYYEYLGFLLADGTSRGWGEYRPEGKERYQRIAAELFGEDGFTLIRAGYVVHSTEVKEAIEKTVPSLALKPKKRVIPSSILADYKKLIPFLKGMYAGDGWFSEDRECSTYGTSSRRLAKQLNKVLAALGISAGYDVNPNSGANSITMYLVRTSHAHSTGLAYNLFAPERCYSGPKEVDAPEARFSTYLVYCAESARVEEAHMAACEGADDETLIKVEEAAAILRDKYGLRPGNLSVRLRSLKNGVGIVQVRERVGGKPTHYTTESRALKASEREFTRVNFTLKNSGISTTGFTERETVSFSQLPDSVTDNYPEGIKDVRMVKITAIEPLSEEKEVYDIAVADQEHFLVNGAVVHNCKHLFRIMNEIRRRRL